VVTIARAISHAGKANSNVKSQWTRTYTGTSSTNMPYWAYGRWTGNV
jgi:hypothetical protein